MFPQDCTQASQQREKGTWKGLESDGEAMLHVGKLNVAAVSDLSKHK